LGSETVGIRRSLGHALWGQNELDAAEAAFRAAAALNPDDALVRLNLGDLLRARGDAAGAVDMLADSLRLDPRPVTTRSSLALALLDAGRPDEAAETCREVIGVAPRNADARRILGQVLQYRGQFAEAVAAIEAAARLVPESREIGAELRAAQRYDAISRRLPRLLDRTERVASTAESLEIADFCRHPGVRRYAFAVRLYVETFAAKSELPARTRAGDEIAVLQDRALYKAACAAICLATGQDATVAVGEEEAHYLLSLARSWLETDLTGLRRLLSIDNGNSRAVARNRIARWGADHGLASLRPVRGRAPLDSGAQEHWEVIWSEAANLARWSARFEEAAAAEGRRDWAAAAAAWGALSRLTPLAADVHMQAARFWRLAGQPATAIPHLLWLGQIDPASLRHPFAKNAVIYGPGDWSIEGREVVASTKGLGKSWLWFGDPRWTDYDVEVEAMYVEGFDGFAIGFRMMSVDNNCIAHVGGWGNTVLGSHVTKSGQGAELPGYSRFAAQPGRWYRTKVEVRGDRLRVWLDGKEVFSGQAVHMSGGVGIRSNGAVNRFRDIRVTAPDGTTLFDGLPHILRPD
jgi:tetratricopeptide (TPR) repeat protein